MKCSSSWSARRRRFAFRISRCYFFEGKVPAAAPRVERAAAAADWPRSDVVGAAGWAAAEQLAAAPATDAEHAALLSATGGKCVGGLGRMCAVPSANLASLAPI